MTILLFAGPSLEGVPAHALAGVEVRPPALCGDLVRALAERPAAVALVDGVFEAGPTVWHKEILYLLGEGVPVYGAASLGALRAAELDRFGMVGVGAIYAAYRDGVLERDDAVMVSHAPAELGHRALTLALVDAEEAIRAAMLPEARACLRALARATNFRERTWRGLFARFAARAGQEAAARAEAAIDTAAPGLKARDTRALLDHLRAAPPAPVARPPAPMTYYLRDLLAGGRR